MCTGVLHAHPAALSAGREGGVVSMHAGSQNIQMPHLPVLKGFRSSHWSVAAGGCAAGAGVALWVLQSAESSMCSAVVRVADMMTCPLAPHVV